MNFRTLKKDDMKSILKFRSQCPQALRTSFLLTEEMQEKFYQDVICNRSSNARFWAIEVDGKLIGMCGIEGIQWENSLGEISIILESGHQGKGYGKQAFELMMLKGFNELNLTNIFGECYESNPAIDFWRKMIKTYNGQESKLFNRKYWQGRYYDALYFNFNKEYFKRSYGVINSECKLNNID